MHKYNFLYKKETRVMQWVGGIGGGDSIEKKKEDRHPAATDSPHT